MQDILVLARLGILDQGPITEVQGVLVSHSTGLIETLILSKQLVGDGLTELRGEKWTIHRMITDDALNTEQVKMN
jgi:hypothetical protein